MKLLNALLLSLVLLLLFSCGNSSQNPEDEENADSGTTILLTSEQREMAGIKTGTFEKRLVADVIDCTGYIDVPPTNQATIHAPINGQVQRISAVPGIKVVANQELAIITDQEIAQLKENFLDQRSNLTYYKSEFERKKKLFEQDAISKKDYLNAQNKYHHEKYSYQSLREQLLLMGISEEELIQNGISSKIIISSPIDGFVSEVFVNIGSFVDEQARMFEIVNYEHVHLELSVYSNDINNIRIGQRVRFNFAGSEEGGWGTIQLIGKKVDEINRSVLVHAHIDSHEQQLTIGSSIIAEILTKADSVLCLPEEAVIQ
jgi:cobalt-zinc-cadmium efflux system membrane fusion protein